MLHYSINEYQRYDKTDIKNSIKNPRKYTVRSELRDSIKLIEDEEFGVGHLIPTKNNIEILGPFKKILLTRDFGEAKRSMEDWKQICGRSYLSLNQSTYEKMPGWKEVDDVFHLQFNDMKNENLSVLDELQIFLFGNVRISSQEAIENAKNKESLTKNEKMV